MQPVTKDEASPKKKRVLVKKHRKKTPAECCQDKKNNTDVIHDDVSDNDDEEMGNVRPRGNTHGTDIIDTQKDDEPWWSGEDEMGKDGKSDESRPPLYISLSTDNMEQHDVVNDGKEVEEDNVSLLDGEEDDDDRQADVKEEEDNVVAFEEVEISKNVAKNHEVAGESEGNTKEEVETKPNVIKQEVDNEGIDDNEGNKDEDGAEDMNSDIICKMTSEDCAGQTQNSPGRTVSTATDSKLDSSLVTTAHSLTSSTLDASATAGVLLVPKISSQPTLNEEGDALGSNLPTDTTLEPNTSPEVLLNSDDVSTSKASFSPRALLPRVMGANVTDSEPSRGILAIPDLSDEDDDGENVKAGGIHEMGVKSIFRESDEDAKRIPEIHTFGSMDTEITSNQIDGLKQVGSSDTLEPLRTTMSTVNDPVFRPYQTDTLDSSRNKTHSPTSELGGSMPINRVESYKSTDPSLSSNISYFSYDEVSMASDECEMCAICICPYEEGDIRIFSKRCPHVFHKECILEWLVKSHNECPCCRIEMVTKTEIKETSQSLMGTERLAQALAVVEGDQMQQAPPFRVRGSRLARQMINRARIQRRRSVETGQPSPGANAGGGDSPSTPRRNNNSAAIFGSSNEVHNRDWLWATRFSSPSPDQYPQPRTIAPARSSDAIMNPHETNHAIAQAPSTPMPSSSGGGGSMHNSSAGSLFVQNNSMYHDHWQQRYSNTRSQRRNTNQAITLSPSRRHIHWARQQVSPPDVTNHWAQRQQQTSGLPVTVLPLSSSVRHQESSNSSSAVF